MYILFKKENKKVKQIYLVLLGNQTYRGSMHINGVVHIADDRTKDPSETKMKFYQFQVFTEFLSLKRVDFRGAAIWLLVGILKISISQVSSATSNLCRNFG